MKTLSKREMIHSLVDKLLDLEESSKKAPFFSYSPHVNAFNFNIAKNKEAYSVKLTDGSVWVSLDDYGLEEGHLEHAYQVIKEVSLLPDTPVEKMVDVQISESRARELGLIA